MMRIPIGSSDWPDWVDDRDRFFKDIPDLAAWKVSPPSAIELGMFCSDTGHAEQPSDIFYASLPYLLDAIESLPSDQQIELVSAMAGRFITALEFRDSQPEVLRSQISDCIPRMNSILSGILLTHRIVDHEQMIAFVAIVMAMSGHFTLCNRVTEIGVDDL